MSNHEQAFQELPNNVGDYFSLGSDGGIGFVDPLYKERLGPWPRMLAHDPISRAGREYLESSEHGLDVIHSLHGDADDFRHILDECSDVLGAAAIIAIEADWDPANGDFSDPAIIKIPDGSRGEFVQAAVDWALQNGKIALPYDIDGPSDPLRGSLKKLWDGNVVPDDDIQFPDIIPEAGRPRLAKTLAIEAYMTMRQPMLLGQIGFGLKNLAENGHMQPDDRIAVILGAGHNPNFVDKAQASEIIPPQRISTSIVEGSVGRLSLEMQEKIKINSIRRAVAGIAFAELVELSG